MSEATIPWPRELFIIDAETTGLNPHRHGLLELCVLHPFSGEGLEWLIDPRPCDFEAAALRVNGLTLESLAKLRQKPVDCLRELAVWIRSKIGDRSRAVLCGRKPEFDKSFLDAAANWQLGAPCLAPEERALFENLFHRRTLDTHGAVMALAIANGVPIDGDSIDGVYMATVGLPLEAKPHTAANGARHCLNGLDRIIREIWRGAPRKCRACDTVMRADLCAKCESELKEAAQ